jgi:hypothetical protein
MIEKFALALIAITRKLREYFLPHHVVVRPDQPIREIMFIPDFAR